MTEVDELEILREAWEQPDPPSPSSRASARGTLMWQVAWHGVPPAGHSMTRPRRRLPSRLPSRLPRRRLALGVAVTATAVAVAVAFGFAQLAFAPAPTAPPTEAGGELPAGGEASTGQQILLAAASTALDQPAEEGAYWYVEEEHDLGSNPDNVPNPQTLARWTARDGAGWYGNLCCAEVYEDLNPAGFRVGGSLLTLEQLQDLPTDGEQLRAWIVDSFANPSGWPPPDQSAPLPGPAEPLIRDHIDVALELSDLLYNRPVPPEVRAAAFRALATMPDVTSLGAMDGGEGLRIAVEPPAADKFPGGELPDGADSITLVIDPATSKLLSFTTYSGTIRILAAEWTDQEPLIP